jgi:hypothetical protein
VGVSELTLFPDLPGHALAHGFVSCPGQEAAERERRRWWAAWEREHPAPRVCVCGRPGGSVWLTFLDERGGPRPYHPGCAPPPAQERNETDPGVSLPGSATPVYDQATIHPESIVTENPDSQRVYSVMRPGGTGPGLSPGKPPSDGAHRPGQPASGPVVECGTERSRVRINDMMRGACGGLGKPVPAGSCRTPREVSGERSEPSPPLAPS